MDLHMRPIPTVGGGGGGGGGNTEIPKERYVSNQACHCASNNDDLYIVDCWRSPGRPRVSSGDSAYDRV